MRLKIVDTTETNTGETVIEDLQAVQAAKKSPLHAERLLRRIYPKICQVARSLSGSRRYADDMAQLAALEIMTSLDNYAGKGTVEAWAGRITYRVSIKMLRKEQQHNRRVLPLVEEVRETGECPESTMARQQLYRSLDAKMAQIPIEQRTTFLLHVLHGYSVDEVAEIMDTPRNTVKYRLKTAYRLMREILLESPALRSELIKEIP